MDERRPRVSLDGAIFFGISECEKKLIELHGLDPDGVIIVRNDTEDMLVRSDGIDYLLGKE